MPKTTAIFLILILVASSPAYGYNLDADTIQSQPQNNYNNNKNGHFQGDADNFSSSNNNIFDSGIVKLPDSFFTKTADPADPKKDRYIIFGKDKNILKTQSLRTCLI